MVGGILAAALVAAAPTYGQGVEQAYRAAPGVTQVAQTYSVTYRPSDAEYVVEEREHFDVIYQRGYHDAARGLGNVLEATRAGTDSLVHGEPRSIQMPVVVDGFTDRSNGFVTPLPFKQEIEAVSIKSNELTTRYSSWPALVGTHELVHAAHAEVDGGIGVGHIVRFFAPDVARSINLIAPRGLTEGIAVYRESTVEEGAGRLNEPFFQMKMRAAMLSDDPWEFTQMMEPPAYTQPFNRFYLGGAYAYRELKREYGTRFFQDVTQNHNLVPFVGFGLWMWLETGDTPAALGNDLRETLRDQFQTQVDALGPLTEPQVVASEAGLNHRRPYWIDDETIVAYVSGYDTRAGFYRIDAGTGQRTNIRVQSLTENYVYSLTPDTTALLASRYVQDPFVPTQALADVERVDLRTGRARRLTDGARVLSPVASGTGTVWGVQNDGPQTQWARVDPDGGARALTGFRNTRFQQIAPSPVDDRIAVVLNVGGQQALYRSRQTGDGPARPELWLGVEGGAVYDVSWGPEGRYLLFTADATGIPNVYVHDTESGTTRRLTNVPYGAYEPALSPDRSTLAFVRYRHERQDLVTMPFEPGTGEVVADSVLRRGEKAGPPLKASAPAGPPAREKQPDRRDYQAWRHLRPRITYPIFSAEEEEQQDLDRPLVDDLGPAYGLGVSAADPLQKWAYDVSAFWQDGRPWGDARVQTGRFLLRPSVFAYNRPSEVVGFSTLLGGLEPAVVKFEERGAGFGVELPTTLQQNVFQSVLLPRLDAEVRQTRYYGDAAEAIVAEGGTIQTSFRTRATLSPRVVLGYRLQQNPRDLVPNTGLVWRNRAEVDVWTDGVPLSRGLVSEVSAYLPFLRDVHTGIELTAGVLARTAGAPFETDTFFPRGYSDIPNDQGLAASGPFLRFDAEVTQPLWYADDGLSIVPIYLKALSAYGFAQSLGEVDRTTWTRRQTSVGGGVGLRMRVFYLLDLNLRVGAAYRVERGDWGLTLR